MSLNNIPSAIVAMPVYNGAEYLVNALDAALQQTFTNFQLLVVDDGSDEETKSILKHYAKRGLKCLHFKKNKGRPFARNKALAYALDSHTQHGTDYLFWMDADDISLPDRLEKQIAFMQSRQDVSILGSSMRCIGDVPQGGKVPIIKKTNSHDAIFAHSIWGVSLLQPTACFRLAHFYAEGSSLLYDVQQCRAEDYAFWIKLLFTTSLKFANMSDVLCTYRYAERKDNNIYHALAAKKLLKYLELPHDEHSAHMHTILSCSSFEGLELKEKISIHEVIHWGNTVFEQVESSGKIDMTHFLRITHHKMERLIALEPNPQERKELLKYYAVLPLGAKHDLRSFF